MVRYDDTTESSPDFNQQSNYYASGSDIVGDTVAKAEELTVELWNVDGGDPDDVVDGVGSGVGTDAARMFELRRSSAYRFIHHE